MAALKLVIIIMLDFLNIIQGIKIELKPENRMFGFVAFLNMDGVPFLPVTKHWESKIARESSKWEMLSLS